MELAELNTDLYDKLFPNQNVKSESEEMKAKVVADFENMFKTDSDRLFTNSI